MAKPKVKAIVATVRAPSGRPLARMVAVPKPPKGSTAIQGKGKGK